MSEFEEVEGDYQAEHPTDLFSCFLVAFGHEAKSDISQACSQRCSDKLGRILIRANRNNTVLDLEADPSVDHITYFEHQERAERVICEGPTRFLGRCTAQVIGTIAGGFEAK